MKFTVFDLREVTNAERARVIASTLARRTKYKQIQKYVDTKVKGKSTKMFMVINQYNIDDALEYYSIDSDSPFVSKSRNTNKEIILKVKELLSGRAS